MGELLLDLGVFRIAGEVVPFQRILVVVVKLLGPVAVTNVAVPFAAQGMIVPAVRRQGRPFPLGFRILQQRNRTAPLPSCR